jgi:hypothetical protein
MFVFHFDIWILLGFLVQTVLPLGIGWLATTSTPASVRWTLTASLTALISLLTTALSAHASGAPFDVFQALLTTLTGLLLSVAAHFGWSNTSLLDRVLNARIKPTPANTKN